MNMVIPNLGKLWFLDRDLNPDGNPGEDWIVSLFKNNYTPVDASVTGDFVQPTFTGSAPITLAAASWPASAIVANVAVSTYPTAPFWSNTDVITETVYGWFAITAVSEICIAAQRFDVARVMTPGANEALDPFTFSLKTFH